MTQEDLLVEIDIQLRHLPSYFHDRDKTILGMKALREVVELHKPNKYGFCDECSSGLCWACSEWGCDKNCDCKCHRSYPCDTIQAIEKEFK